MKLIKWQRRYWDECMGILGDIELETKIFWIRSECDLHGEQDKGKRDWDASTMWKVDVYGH